MRQWPAGIEVVEVETGSGVVDLHNEATLLDIRIDCRPELSVTLRFGTSDGREAELAFGSVTGLSFRQDEADGVAPFASGWDPGVAATFYGVEFRPAGEGRGEFEVDTIVGTLTLSAAAVSFRTG
jgi:hypothetical protein